MRNKKKRLLLLLLSCVLLFAFYRSINPLAGYQRVELPLEYRLPEYISLNSTDTGALYLTRDQALYDFDYMWTMLFKCAPLLTLMKEESNDSIKELNSEIAKIRHEIKTQDQIFLEDFSWYLNRSFGKIFGKGHFGTISHPQEYGAFHDTFERYQNESYLHQKLYEVLNNPKTKETYIYLQQAKKEFWALFEEDISELHEDSAEKPDWYGQDDLEEEIPIIELNSSYLADDLSEVISLTIQEGVPVLTISTVLLQNDLLAIERIQELLEKYSQAENLIIDIRGNGGGNGGIFIKGVVEPLIGSGGNYYVTMGYQESLQMQYFHIDEKMLSSQTRAQIDHNQRYYSNVIFKDRVTYYIEPSQNHIHFEGNLWVLIDENVASAAEKFTTICKRMNLATIIGETTTGAGNSGQPVVFPLPNSGLLVMYEDIVGYNEDGTVTSLAGISPDIANDEDADALSTCLRLIKEGYIYQRDPYADVHMSIREYFSLKSLEDLNANEQSDNEYNEKQDSLKE